VVQTLHDYKLVCPNYMMFVNGRVCERCADWRYWNACARRCMRGSLSSSALVCLEAYVHRILGSYRRHVRFFIAPSRSMRDRVIAHGIDADRVVHVPHAIDLSGYAVRSGDEGYAVFVGRLSEGKGVMTLLRAAALARDVRLIVVGTGPLSAEAEGYAARKGLANVEFVGYHEGESLKSLVAGAAFVVVPSEWYENAPLAVYEAFALGKPVIGSAVGGIPELVLEGLTGLLYPAGDAEALAARLRELWADRSRAADMGRAARRRVEEEFGSERHYDRIMEIYERAMN